MSGGLVLVPALDEETALPALLAELARVAPEHPVVVVDDGSRDGTARVAAAGGARVLRHPFNLGYGAALQTGYKYALARGVDWLVQMDADGQHPAGEIAALAEPVRRGECDLAVGSRFLAGGDYPMGPARNAGRQLFRAVARACGLAVTDPTSGFQALGPRAIALFADDWFPTDYPDVDVLLVATRAGLRVREHPVRMSEASRPSTLHGGWKPLYYVYKMLLSTWAATAQKGTVLERAQMAERETPRPRSESGGG
jgi:glycosyltransferase involved in cell wall biosynthesis